MRAWILGVLAGSVISFVRHENVEVALIVFVVMVILGFAFKGIIYTLEGK